MPYRRRGARRPKRKTRWVAITPDAQTFSVNATAFKQLVPIDAGGTINISEFYGATVSKIILDVSSNFVPFPPDPLLEQRFSGTIYGGLFVSNSVIPETTIWSPSLPSGNYMTRDVMSVWWYREPEVMMANLGGEAYHNFPMMRLETNVSRKLTENSRIFAGFQASAFDWNDVSVWDIGWSGRMLITLP